MISIQNATAADLEPVMGVICLDLVGKCNPFMVIENVIVKNSCRGQGIGIRLTEEIEHIGRKRNCNHTMFVSRSDRLEAHMRQNEVKIFLGTNFK